MRLLKSAARAATTIDAIKAGFIRHLPVAEFAVQNAESQRLLSRIAVLISPTML